jgi:hypothetical protein
VYIRRAPEGRHRTTARRPRAWPSPRQVLLRVRMRTTWWRGKWMIVGTTSSAWHAHVNVTRSPTRDRWANTSAL